MIYSCVEKNLKDVESLINTVRIFSDGIGMEFGLAKCATITMKQGNIMLPAEKEIRELQESKEYNYLVVLEADDTEHTQMKDKIYAKYTRRVRKVLKTS